MRHPALFAPAVLLLAAGCSQPSPALPDATAAKTPAPAAAPNTVLGRYTLEIDPVTLTARVTAPRAAQDNDGVYLLPIDSFLSTGGVTVQKVRLTATTLDIDYTFTHPFPASGTTNRADLGVSGFLLFFADVPSTTGHRYFTGTDDVVVNTGLVANADAYWAPRGLLDTEAYTANTFPYKLLVDEANDPRLDAASGAPVSNGGNPTGNYTAPNGWQTGGSETWTGYGVLHQGQAATSTVGLDLTALEAADFSLDFAAIAKYNDPRSGTPPKAHRLPSSPPNLLTGFGYRMPHGALDVERIVYRGEGGGFQAETASSSELRFHVRDWDAQAVPTTEASLAADPDGTHVTADAVGEPSLSVCIPGVLGDDTAFFETGDVPTADDSAYGGDAAADSGQPGDEIFFAATVPQPATAGQSAGTYTGLVRAADPETGNEPYLVHLRGDLSPVTTSKPAPVTYQVLTVTVAVPPAPPGWAVRLGGTGFDFVRGVCTDSAGSVYAIGHFSGSADFGGGPRTSVGGTDIFLVKLNSDGSYAWDAVYGGSSDDIGTAIARDSADSLWITGGFRTTVNFGGGPLTAAGGSDVFLVKLDPITGGHLSSARYGGAGNDQANGVAVGVLNYPAITGQFIANVDFGGGNLASAGMADIFAAAFLSNGAHRWSKRFGGPADDFGSAICSYPADGSFALCGEFWNTINFGGPNRTSAGLTDIFLLRLDGVLGTYMFDRTFGGTNEEHAWGVAANVSSTVAMTGFFFSPVDFGGGPLNPGRMFLAAYDGTGTPLWSRSHGANSQEYSRAVAVDPNGDFCTVTAFIGTVNFGSGPLVAVGSTDIAISKYSGVSGAPLWSQRVGGSGTDESFAVTSLPNGDFVYAGAFRNTVDFDPGPGTFDLSAAGANDDAFVSRLSGTTGLW